MRTGVLATALVVSLLTGCAGSPDRAADHPPVLDADVVEDRPQAAASEGAPPPAAGNRVGSKPQNAPPARHDPSVGVAEAGAPEPGSAPPTREAPPDDRSGEDRFGRGTPDGAVPVASGRTPAATEWRLYAFRDDGETCAHFAAMTQTAGGGATGSCSDPPLDPSTMRIGKERFAFGMTSSEVARVRFEHAGGGAETFDAVTSPYPERYFAGEIAGTPLTRIVALDARGRVVAERTDMARYNV